MAIFNCYIYATGQTTARIEAEVKEGSSSFIYNRYIFLYLNGSSTAYGKYVGDGSGTETDWSNVTVSGLSAGTTYSYVAKVYAGANVSGATYTGLSESGSFTTQSPPTTNYKMTAKVYLDGTDVSSTYGGTYTTASGTQMTIGNWLNACGASQPSGATLSSMSVNDVSCTSSTSFKMTANSTIKVYYTTPVQQIAVNCVYTYNGQQVGAGVQYVNAGTSKTFKAWVEYCTGQTISGTFASGTYYDTSSHTITNPNTSFTPTADLTIIRLSYTGNYSVTVKTYMNNSLVDSKTGNFSLQSHMPLEWLHSFTSNYSLSVPTGMISSITSNGSEIKLDDGVTTSQNITLIFYYVTAPTVRTSIYSSGWKSAQPYIYIDGKWHTVYAYVYSGSSWVNG